MAHSKNSKHIFTLNTIQINIRKQKIKIHTATSHSTTSFSFVDIVHFNMNIMNSRLRTRIFIIEVAHKSGTACQIEERRCT